MDHAARGVPYRDGGTTFGTWIPDDPTSTPVLIRHQVYCILYSYAAFFCFALLRSQLFHSTRIGLAMNCDE